METYTSAVPSNFHSDEVRLRRMAFSEWIELSRDEPGEWVDGWLVEEEVGTRLHDVVVAWIISAIGPSVFASGGLVFASELKVALSGTRGRKPDVTMLRPGRGRIADAPVLDFPPDVAVEVVSSSPQDQRRDRIAKFAEYAAFSVRWYWIVDPQARTVEIFELGTDGRYARAVGATDGVIEVPGFDGLTLDLTALWAIIDARLG